MDWESALASRIPGVFAHERCEAQRGRFDASEHVRVLQAIPWYLHGYGLPLSEFVPEADQKKRIARPIEQDSIMPRQTTHRTPQSIEILERKSASNDKMHRMDMPRKNEMEIGRIPEQPVGSTSATTRTVGAVPRWLINQARIRAYTPNSLSPIQPPNMQAWRQSTLSSRMTNHE